MVDRDYSMMITHQPNWIKSVSPYTTEIYRKTRGKYTKSVVVYDTKEDTYTTFKTCKEADFKYGWSTNRASKCSISGNMIGKRYLVKAAE
jgi:hypothetical protein